MRKNPTVLDTANMEQEQAPPKSLWVKHKIEDKQTLAQGHIEENLQFLLKLILLLYTQKTQTGFNNKH